MCRWWPILPFDRATLRVHSRCTVNFSSETRVRISSSFYFCRATIYFIPCNEFSFLSAYYLAMMRFVEAARRSGKLSLVPPILEAAEKHSNRAKYESGLFYCKGLYEWHTGEACFFINKVENDPSSSHRKQQRGNQALLLDSLRHRTRPEGDLPHHWDLH